MGKLSSWLQSLKGIPESSSAIPQHIAIIMDGNGRWATRRGLPRTAGHQKGMERVREAIDVCLEFGVSHLTLYAFSTENWQRPKEEVGFLMKLFLDVLKTEVTKMHQKGVKLLFIGAKQNLEPTLAKLMDESEELTGKNQKMTLNIAINYGGRAELVAAVKGIAAEVQTGTLQLQQVNEDTISRHLFSVGQPDPDLLIRPGGEQRISNFLIWQTAYTELYFSNLFWPDFGRNEFLESFRYYSKRQRRYGKV